MRFTDDFDTSTENPTPQPAEVGFAEITEDGVANAGRKAVPTPDFRPCKQARGQTLPTETRPHKHHTPPKPHTIRSR